MLMAVPNPYLIYINLFWPDGTRPNQNQIARVRAYDVNGGAVTWEGESGFNPGTGGWFPIYMQNIAAFSPPRDQPNLKFEVWNTAEQLVYTTQVFTAIPSSSTVKIIIGVSASIDGGTGTTWLVSGTVRHQDNSLLTAGSVKVLDITAGSEKVLATATLGASGTYTVGFNTSDFTSNGSSHASPNLWVRVYSTGGDLLAQTGPVVGTANQVINVTVPNDTGTGGDTQRRVFGTVKNELGLAVAGILLEAYHVAWTIQGIQEIPLGPVAPGVAADGAGKYEILYDAPVVATPANPCGTAVGQVNLIVYAKEPNGSGGFKTLFTSEVIFDAPAEQEVDPSVDKVAVSTDSEYKRIDDAISACLGDTVTAKYDTLNTLAQRPEYLAFVAKTTGVEPTLLSGYVHGWLIAGAINDKTPASALSRPMSPEVIYALLRVLSVSSLGELLNVLPDALFDAVVRAVHQGIVGSALEMALYPDPAFGNLSLIDDWRTVLAKLMNQAALAWQAQRSASFFRIRLNFRAFRRRPTSNFPPRRPTPSTYRRRSRRAICCSSSSRWARRRASRSRHRPATTSS
jgi:hypothetical protein